VRGTDHFFPQQRFMKIDDVIVWLIGLFAKSDA
jgi:hypothetical protein